ncbi:30S ribosomal protein S1 [Syntrophus aciditrophicus]|uniref:Small ribosomal subunit protein bS1 n=1 Tax=Syntrophus aciditrophicus (strain SB) TaxID=56780 RepID=Q2LSR9_SYNAS|nr:30S ribosomal protein S1 [Syntrophus aciditrophicus]ABC77127.1 SSU ribosomal protein S1P [Syntrophus aciditrophicus SB]OPY18207.1 MAG: 30S ribosomal protein S1 [Syntrophus sp. PtaB.Bin075]
MVNDDNLISEQKEEKGEGGGNQQNQNSEDMMGFKELYEQSLQSVHLGELVTGKIVQINSDMVMVDVGWKTEGYIPAKELRDEEGNIAVNVGDEIEVMVERRDQEGNLVLSRDKAAKMKIWDDVKAACDNNLPVKGMIVERVKGGLSVDIGISAFLPGSQVDIRPVRDLDKYVGQTLMFDVLKYDRKRNNVVLSRRSILEQEREVEKQETLANISEGVVVEGIIKNITDYGLFIDLGGIDGLLHVTDISWGRITKPSEAFNRGDKITVKVLSFDREKERVSLGLKQLTENPWEMITEQYPVGAIVEGKVVNLTDYGAFVELAPGVEGLIHVSEMFWTREIRHPSKVLSLGQNVKVMILDVNKENKRISLGLKQTTDNPWETLKQKYPEGTLIKGVIRNVTNFGIFVGVEDGIDGLVHVSDISWKQRVKHPSEIYKKGQEIEAVVLNIDVESEKFSLGIKQIEKNPWEEFCEKYTAGSIVSGKVTNLTEFGIFVEVEEGIEGLVHISELSHKRVKTASEIFSIGDAVSAVVKSVDVKGRKIRLSIKDTEVNPEAGRSVSQYLNNRENVGSSLGKALADLDVKLTDPNN